MAHKNRRYNTSSSTIKKMQEQERHESEPQRSIICRCCLLQDNDEMIMHQLGSPVATMGLNTGESNKYSGNDDSSPTAKPPTLLIDLLNICTRIDATLKDVAMPQHICLDCYKALETCYDFISCVQNADQILRAKFMKPFHIRPKSENAHDGQYNTDVIGNTIYRKVITTEGDIVRIYNANDNNNAVAELIKNNMPTSSTLTTATTKMSTSSENSPLLLSSEESGNTNNAQLAKAYSTTTEMGMSEASCMNMRSLDSGIEMVDDDFISLSNRNESSKTSSIDKKFYMEAYEGVKYVIPQAIADDLKHFHDNLNAIYGKYKCGFCLFQSHTPEKLESHLEKHLGPPRYKCHLCTFACHFHHILKSHKKNVHNLSEAEIAEDSTNPHRIKYRCNICNLYLINLASLQEHIKMHEATYFQCTMCTLKNSKRDIIIEHMAREHQVYIDQKIMAQYIPQKTIMYNNNNDSNNNNTSESITEYVPTETLTTNLGNSKELNNNEVRKHLCQFCGKPFDRKMHLLKHEYMYHNKNFNNEAYRNKILNKSLSAKLKQHKKKQLLEPILDPESNESSQMEDCLDYIDDYHKNTKNNEQPHEKFKCTQCTAEFLFNSELKYHMLTHKDDVANLCNLTADDDNATPSPFPSNLLVSSSSTPAPFFSCSPFDINPPQISSTASPLSSLSNFDLHDGQLYLNDFDLDLLNF